METCPLSLSVCKSLETASVLYTINEFALPRFYTQQPLNLKAKNQHFNLTVNVSFKIQCA